MNLRLANCNYPPDVVLEISHYLDKRSILALRLVNRYIHDILTPIALRHVQLLFCGNPERIGERLAASASSLPNVYKHTQHLSVITEGRDDVRAHISDSIIPDVWNTLSLLSKLKSFTLKWSLERVASKETAEWVREIQVRATSAVFTATGGRLEKLSISQPEPFFPDHLLGIRGLRSLHITGKFGCIGKSERSESEAGEDGDGEFGVDGPFDVDEEFDADEESRDGDEEFRVCDGENPPMENGHFHLINHNPGIESLHLICDCCDGGGLGPRNVIPSCLTNLQSWTMQGLSFPLATASFFDPTPLRNLRRVEMQRLQTPSSDLELDGLWKSMKDAGTCLETLTTTQVSYCLADYLSSFSGLRQLKITQIGRNPDCLSLRTIEKFFNVGLGCHASTINTLILAPAFHNPHVKGWVFDPLSWPKILTPMTSLTSLHIHSGKLERNHEFVRTVYQSILDCVEHLPNLQTLEIYGRPPDLDFSRDSVALEPNHQYHFLEDVVRELVCTTGRPALLIISRGDWKWHARRGAKTGIWRYLQVVPDY